MPARQGALPTLNRQADEAEPQPGFTLPLAAVAPVKLAGDCMSAVDMPTAPSLGPLPTPFELLSEFQKLPFIVPALLPSRPPALKAPDTHMLIRSAAEELRRPDPVTPPVA